MRHNITIIVDVTAVTAVPASNAARKGWGGYSSTLGWLDGWMNSCLPSTSRHGYHTTVTSVAGGNGKRPTRNPFFFNYISGKNTTRLQHSKKTRSVPCSVRGVWVSLSRDRVLLAKRKYAQHRAPKLENASISRGVFCGWGPVLDRKEQLASDPKKHTSMRT